MSWPLASHFSAMLQNPRVAFRDPHLQGCSIEKDERRQPRPWAGAFAVVYKAYSAHGGVPFAVRVFTTESPERRDRYDLINAYLKDRKLKCLVEFEYRDRSIRSAGDGRWYPLILMEWVQGDTLFKWLRARCLEDNTAAIRNVADRWTELVKELGEASVAHGDLQHANVMVTDAGEVKLVDYDCLCVPALLGRRNLEVGVEPYQHPGRNESTLLSLDLDNFSALMIYVGLRALAVTPQLWIKYIEQTGYDKLLFRSEDLRAPQASPLCADLMSSPDQEVRDLSAQLFSLYHVPVNQVPALSALANPFAKVEEHLQQREWEAAVKLLNRRGSFRDAPQHLQPLIREAYEFVCRKQAWTAYCKIPAETSEPNDRRLVDTWNEQLFAGFEPAERERLRVAEARQRVTILDRLYHLIQQVSGAIHRAGEQSIVEVADQLPQGYQYSFRARVEQARRRIQVARRMDQVLDKPTAEAAIVAAWRAMVEADCRSFLDPGWLPRIELAERRAEVLKQLYAIPDDAPADEHDRRLVDIWQEPLLADCPEADKWLGPHETARARRDLVAQLQTALESGDEARVLQLMKEPSLKDYPLPAEVSAVARGAQERSERREALLAALREQRQAEFYDLFDARVVCRHAAQFTPFESLLLEWTQTEVLPLEKLGLKPAAGGRGIEPVDEPGRTHRLRWIWPPPRFVARCLVMVCSEEPAEDDDPEIIPSLYCESVEWAGGEQDDLGRLVSMEPEWRDCRVVVYAVVDLGLRTLYSPPLVLGRLGARSRWWKGWGILKSRRNEAAPGHLQADPQAGAPDAAGEDAVP